MVIHLDTMLVDNHTLGAAITVLLDGLWDRLYRDYDELGWIVRAELRRQIWDLQCFARGRFGDAVSDDPALTCDPYRDSLGIVNSRIHQRQIRRAS